MIVTLFSWISAANEAVWGWCVLWLLVGVSVGLTFLLKGFQFWKWRTMFAVFDPGILPERADVLDGWKEI